MLENVIVSPVPELVTPQVALPDPKYIFILLLDWEEVYVMTTTHDPDCVVFRYVMSLPELGRGVPLIYVASIPLIVTDVIVISGLSDL